MAINVLDLKLAYSHTIIPLCRNGILEPPFFDQYDELYPVLANQLVDSFHIVKHIDKKLQITK